LLGFVANAGGSAIQSAGLDGPGPERGGKNSAAGAALAGLAIDVAGGGMQMP
jgi:hypothetical protein